MIFSEYDTVDEFLKKTGLTLQQAHAMIDAELDQLKKEVNKNEPKRNKTK